MAAQSDRLIFLHIPKTGGSTLDQLMRKQFDPTDVIRINRKDPRFTGGSPPSETSHRYVSGHFPFGLHQSLPGSSRYITMLREPTARAISHYHSWLRRNRLAKSDMPLKEFLDAGHFVDNHQTRLVSGHRRVDGPIGESTLDEARRNLAESFLFVGLTERFDESVILLSSKVGWEKPPVYVRRNTTIRPLRVQDLSEDELAVIRQSNELDYALYDFAKQNIDEQIQAVGSSMFTRHVQAYRRRNFIVAKASQVTVAARNYMPAQVETSLYWLRKRFRGHLPANE